MLFYYLGLDTVGLNVNKVNIKKEKWSLLFTVAYIAGLVVHKEKVKVTELDRLIVNNQNILKGDLDTMPRWVRIATVLIMSVLGVVFLAVGTFVFPFHFIISLILGVALLIGTGVLTKKWQV